MNRKVAQSFFSKVKKKNIFGILFRSFSSENANILLNLFLNLFQGPVNFGLCCLCPEKSFFGERLEEFLRHKQKLH